MELLSLIYVLVITAGVLIQIGLAAQALPRWRFPGVRLYIVVMLLYAVTAFSFLMLTLSTTPEAGFFWARARFISMGFGIVMSFLFVLELTRTRLPALMRLALFALPITTQIVLWTGDLHTYFFGEWRIIPRGLFVVEQSRYTGWFWVHMVAGNLMFCAGIFLLARQVRRATPEERSAWLWFLGGLFVGFGLSTVQPLFPNVLPFNPTPMAALVMGLAHAQAFIRLRLLDVLPAALRTVFDHIQDAVIVFNERGEVVDSNPVARQLGTSATLAELLREYHSAAGDSVGAHIEIRRGDTLFDARLSPLKHREQLVGWLLVLRDITERRRMEKTLVENERIQAAYEKERELGDLKTRMMIRIAHEFRTPLAVILTSSESLERYNERMTAEQRRDKFRTIGKQIGHLSMMLDDLGMAVRSPTRQDRARTAFDLKALCDEVAGAFHKMNEGTHRLTLHTSEQKVCADEAGVRALLLNLLSNAAKYSPVGSDISLSAWGEDGDLWLRVCDSGIGICEPDQPHIFEPFYRGRNIDEVPGLGVGLTIVREIVRAHSGSITVRSIPGEETSFTVCLPGAAHALPAFVM